MIMSCILKIGARNEKTGTDIISGIPMGSDSIDKHYPHQSSLTPLILLHPEILDDITEYVRIPDKVAKESRRVLSQSSTKKRVTRQT